MPESFLDNIDEIVKTSRDIWLKGWTEISGGNISVRLDARMCRDEGSFRRNSDWVELEVGFDKLAGAHFLITGAGMFLRNIEISPAAVLGVIELDESGRRYRLVWGYQKGGRPTSELPSHLQAHSTRRQVGDNLDRVFIHCHPPHLIALTHALELDTARLTRLLWQMHIECIVMFPEGVEFIPWRLSGSLELARATAAGLKKRRAVLWQFHGLGAVGETLDRAFGLIHVLEKSAEIYLKAHALGGIKNELTLEQMLTLAQKFDIKPDEEIVKSFY